MLWPLGKQLLSLTQESSTDCLLQVSCAWINPLTESETELQRGSICGYVCDGCVRVLWHTKKSNAQPRAQSSYLRCLFVMPHQCALGVPKGESREGAEQCSQPPLRRVRSKIQKENKLGKVPRKGSRCVCMLQQEPASSTLCTWESHVCKLGPHRETTTTTTMTGNNFAEPDCLLGHTSCGSSPLEFLHRTL